MKTSHHVSFNIYFLFVLLIVSSLGNNIYAQRFNRTTNSRTTEALKLNNNNLKIAPTDNNTEEFSPNAQTRQVVEVMAELPFHTSAQKVSVELVDGLAVMEGDIILGPAILFNPDVQASVVIKGNNFRWPNGRVPYIIDGNHPKKQTILDAIEHVNEKTNVCVLPRTNETDYIKFVYKSGCWSSVGRQGGAQEISIGNGCGFGSAVHEICHAIGAWHEQSRGDRDSHINILWENIKEDKKHNFNKHSADGIDIGSYDFGSIMHYGATAFSKNGKPTISSKVAGKSFGQRSGMSAKDIAGIKAIYPTSVGCGSDITWVSHHGMTSAEYQKKFNQYVGESKMTLTHISGYNVNGTDYYAAIWEKQSNPPQWVARHGMTSAQYQAEFDKWTKQGYRPTTVSGYSVGNSARYAAIFRKVPGGSWVARHGLTSAQYQAEFNKWTKDGYRPVVLSGYGVNGTDYYAVVFEKTSGGAWVARHGLTSAQYQAEFNKWTKDGYRPVNVSGYYANGSDRYAVIFEKTSGGAWIARHGLTSRQYQAEFNKNSQAGYELIDVSGYSNGSSARYAAIWQKPTNRFKIRMN
ncbi:MAG: M12 family metallopeptidase [Chitinophagales bacterium]